MFKIIPEYKMCEECDHIDINTSSLYSGGKVVFTEVACKTFEVCNRAYLLGLKAANPKGWTLCKKEQPPYNKPVLLYFKKYEHYRKNAYIKHEIALGIRHDQIYAFFQSCDMQSKTAKYDDVIAWMPIPDTSWINDEAIFDEEDQ